MSCSSTESSPPAELFDGDEVVQLESYIASILEAAKEYAVLGLPVFSLAYRAKRPDNRRGWQERATTDPHMVDRRFSQDQPENLGLAAGRGIFFVLDVDPGAKDLNHWLASKLSMAPFPRRLSPGQDRLGCIITFEMEPGTTIRNSVNLWPGLDIRGDGGLIVAAPSIHPDTGRPYEWVRHPREGIAPPPPWLLRVLLDRSMAGRNKKDGRHAEQPKGQPKTDRQPRARTVRRQVEPGRTTRVETPNRNPVNPVSCPRTPPAVPMAQR